MNMPWFYEAGIRVVSKAHQWMFRTLGWPNYLGRDLILLKVRGRKSGREISVPLLYLVVNDSVYTVASFMGNDRAPAWYLNILANPSVRARIGGIERPYDARKLSAAEADSIWPELVAMYPAFESYKGRTTREISVVELKPVAS